MYNNISFNTFIIRGFYAEEIQPVAGNFFKIEKKLAERIVRGQRQILVKWLGKKCNKMWLL